MLKNYIIFFSLCLAVNPAFSEVVTTTDGRKITLNDDGTFQIEATSPNVPLNIISNKEPFFEVNIGEHKQESIRFMPIVENISDKTIVGFKFSSSFQNAFGDEVFTFSGDSSEKIIKNSKSTANMFYFFENNSFINDEVYDKLLPMAVGGTGKILTKINAIVFEDGEIVRMQLRYIPSPLFPRW